jgi:invasion protein IalB
MAALSVVPAVSQEPEIGASADSPWTKFCFQEACFVGKGRHSYCGLIAEATLVERKMEIGKLLSIGLPTRVHPDRAIRITIDSNELANRPISKCNQFGCWADHEAGAELVEQLKRGQTLLLEAANRDDTPHTVTIPLAGFAEAYDGPPTPMPAIQERIVSEAQMYALREQDKRAKEERRTRCGLPP